MRSLLHACSVLAVVSVVAFAFLVLGPNPLEQLRRNPEYTDADVARITHQYGWDRPLPEQYAAWLVPLLHGDAGTSLVSGRPAAEVIGERLPLTLAMMGAGELLGLAGAFLLGRWQARVSARAQLVSGIATFAFIALPGVVVALLLQLGAVLAQQRFGWSPISVAGMPLDATPVDYARHLALPVFVLALGPIATWSRLLRNQLGEEEGRTHVLVARAKGMPSEHVERAHVLPHAVRPFVPMLALDVAGLLGGALLVERVFALPGTGSLFLESVAARDYVVVLDLVMLGAVLLIVANACSDLALRRLDPRLRGAPA